MTIFIFAHSAKLKQVWNGACEQKIRDVSKSTMILAVIPRDSMPVAYIIIYKEHFCAIAHDVHWMK